LSETVTKATPNGSPAAGAPSAAPGAMPAPGGGAPSPASGAKRRRLLLPVAIIGIVAILAVVAYYYVQGSLYVSTNDANVTGNIVYIYPPASGTLTTWTASMSQQVQAGAVLGSIVAPSGATQPADAASIGVPVTAPLAGAIIQNDAVVGEQVSPSFATPLAAEVDLGNLWVVANVEETTIGRVHIGQRADVTVDALPGRTFSCSVTAIQQATESVFSLLPAGSSSSTFTKVTQRVPVQVRCPDASGWTPGLSAEVRIHVG